MSQRLRCCYRIGVASRCCSAFGAVTASVWPSATTLGHASTNGRLRSSPWPKLRCRILWIKTSWSLSPDAWTHKFDPRITDLIIASWRWPACLMQVRCQKWDRQPFYAPDPPSSSSRSAPADLDDGREAGSLPCFWICHCSGWRPMMWPAVGVVFTQLHASLDQKRN
jgi:hypothetical protein